MKCASALSSSLPKIYFLIFVSFSVSTCTVWRCWYFLRLSNWFIQQISKTSTWHMIVRTLKRNGLSIARKSLNVILNFSGLVSSVKVFKNDICFSFFKYTSWSSLNLFAIAASHRRKSLDPQWDIVGAERELWCATSLQRLRGCELRHHHHNHGSRAWSSRPTAYVLRTRLSVHSWHS